MEVKFFKTPAHLNKWFQNYGDKKTELWIGFYKKAVTYVEALDEALCYGWIDGIRKTVDTISYTNRFTPRKKNSIWSNINSKKIEELIKQGRVQEAGLKAYAAKDPKRAGIYSSETEEKKLPPSFLKKFRQNKKAWNYFNNKAPGYRRTCIYLVMSAKTEVTREKRLEVLIAHSENETTIPQLTPNRK